MEKIEKIELTDRALERRIKRYFTKETHTYFASCTPGMESVLETELKLIEAATDVKAIDGGVEFAGPATLIYETNLKLRTANRVLLRVFDFKSSSYPELFNKSRTKRWEVILGNNTQAKINVTAKKSRLHHTDKIATTIRDGINKYYEQFGFAIELADTAPLELFIRVIDDRFTISLDTTGELLHKRGYKTGTVDAPLRETIASGLLMKTGMHRYPVIVDPCCGSGTFILEAASIFADGWPGIARHFAFEQMPFFNKEQFTNFKLKNERSSSVHILAGFDINHKAVITANRNKESLGQLEGVSFNEGDATTLPNTWGDYGLVIANLPYGVRLSKNTDELKNLYMELGRNLSRNFKGWDVLLLANRSELITLTRLKLKPFMTFDNGGIKVHAFFGAIK